MRPELIITLHADCPSLVLIRNLDPFHIVLMSVVSYIREKRTSVKLIKFLKLYMQGGGGQQVPIAGSSVWLSDTCPKVRISDKKHCWVL